MRAVRTIAGAILAVGFAAAVTDAAQRFGIVSSHAPSALSVAAHSPASHAVHQTVLLTASVPGPSARPSTFAERFDAADPPTR